MDLIISGIWVAPLFYFSLFIFSFLPPFTADGGYLFTASSPPLPSEDGKLDANFLGTLESLIRPLFFFSFLPDFYGMRSQIAGLVSTLA